MRVLTYFVALSFAGAAFAAPPSKKVIVDNTTSDPVPVIVQNTAPEAQQTLVEYRYVGITAAETSGSVSLGPGGLVGLSGLNQMCAEEFGRPARVASPLEASSTTYELSANPRDGWVYSRMPRIDPVGDSWQARDSETLARLDFERGGPNEALEVAQCGGFQTDSSTSGAAALNGIAGNILLRSCADIVPVACSLPVALPATSLP